MSASVPHVAMTPPRFTRWLGVGIGMLTIAAVIALFVAAVVTTPPSGSKWSQLYILAFLGPPTVGTVIVANRPRTRIGWMLIGVGGFVAVGAGSELMIRHLARTTSLGVGSRLVAVVGSATWVLGYVLVAFVVATFPDDQIDRRWWRYVVRTAGAITACGCVLVMLDPVAAIGDEALRVVNPLGVRALDSVIAAAMPVILIALAVFAVVATIDLVVRYRRSTGERRLQMRWFAFSVSALVALLLLTVAAAFFFQAVVNVVAMVAFVGGLNGIAAAIGIALMKYRLYEIDVVISKTLVFGGLAAFITLAYVGVVVGIGTLLGRGDEPNLALSIAATALVAVAFQPVRERLTRVANRLVYGVRASPYQVLSDFSAHLGTQPASEATLVEMARLLALGTGARTTSVWLDLDGRMALSATWPLDADVGDEPSGDRVVEVTHEGVRLGALAVTKDRGEPLTPVEQTLIDDLAAQAGLVLRNLRLNAELRQRLVDLRESRRRLVAAQDTERRRLERDLHDGAQQQLVALKIKLGLAKRLAEQEHAPKAASLLDTLTTETDDAVATLRALAHGIYPPLLASDGLPAALDAAARRVPIPVTVAADGVGRYPPDVEAAVYYCVLEALQNTTKYANGTSATVTLTTDDAHLTFKVRDNGRGFDTATVRPGAGTTNMTDRLDALDGTLTITSTPGQGATVRGTLPAGATVPT